MIKTCANCGNKYDKAFAVVMNGKESFFDSFECAINKMAPRCEHCNTTIIGHGVEAENEIFCCAHCANAKGHNLVDRPAHEKQN